MATEQEIIRSQQEKIELLEEAIEKFMAGKKEIGQVVALPHDGWVRVRIGHEEVIVPIQAKLDNLKLGDSVMVVKDVVEDIVPEQLKVKDAEPEYTQTRWEEIGGLKSQVERIREAVEFPVRFKKYYKDFHLSQPKGVLLHGAPGCGKTLIAKAIASAMGGKSFVYLKGGELLSPLVGVAEQNIKEMFERARDAHKKTGQRSVIFIDEAEAILPARGSRRSSDVETTIVPTFLSEMDGFEEGATFIILATNFPNQLDDAVLRPGRIDLKIEVARPTLEDSAEIFDVYLSKYSIVKNSAELSQSAAEYLFSGKCVHEVSGAFIAQVVQEASVHAIKRHQQTGKDYTILLEDIKAVLDSKNC